MTDTTSHIVEPIQKTRVVPIDPETAFTLFTNRLGDWWPMTEHSVSGEIGASIAFGDAAGTAVVETMAGKTHVWAEVLVSDEPDRVVLAWHPGAEPRPASQLDVRFVEHDSGTEVLLKHSGWERYGDAGADRGIGLIPCPE